MASTRAAQARGVRILAVLACALGCGGRVGAESETSGPSSALPRGPTFVPPGRPAQVPARPAPPRGARPMAPPGPMNPPPSPAPLPEAADLARAAVENVLAANCYSCHGDLADPATSGGITFINDVDALVAAGLIVPLNSAGSRIVQVMRDGSMPPRASGYPPVSEVDLEIVSAFIDNPRFWPDGAYAPPVADAGAAPAPPVADAGTAPAPPVSDPGATPAPPVSDAGAPAPPVLVEGSPPPAVESGADAG